MSIAIRVGADCLLLGRAEFRHFGPGRYEFEFVEPLTSGVLEVVRPSVPDPVLPAPAWVDLVAARPQEALTLFVESWFARSRQPSINTSAEAVPAALAAFYRLAEERPGILGSHNYVHEPEPDRCGRGEEHFSFARSQKKLRDAADLAGMPYDPTIPDIVQATEIPSNPANQFINVTPLLKRLGAPLLATWTGETQLAHPTLTAAQCFFDDTADDKGGALR